ncbi:MAG: 4'-phosphopantetheinyl transferase superfamily protein [Clostridia bacterium]|nr:4'-phosphopantetheinyl transferase superfamily protein [Clostridia bacterium]
MTDIYVMSTDFLRDTDTFSFYYNRLPDHRKEKADKLRFSDDKRMSVGSWLLLKTALQKKGIDGDIRISISDYGKPFLTDYTDVFFSLSHSFDRVMCAVCDGDVGCDIQYRKAVSDRIADRFFHPNEAKALNNISDPDERSDCFYRLWTLKESFMKTVGTGFSLPLKEFEISIGDRISVNQNVSNKEFFFREFSSDSYRLAVCSTTDGFSKINQIFL